MNKISLIAVFLTLTNFAHAQTLIDELLPPPETGGTLRDISSSLTVPEEVIEVQPPISDVAKIAHLRALDRITGKVEDITITVGDVISFERLEIVMMACRYPQGDINADAFAQMSIKDIREDTPRFTGWMFASSPALSALDHPRYDVWVLNCSNE